MADDELQPRDDPDARAAADEARTGVPSSSYSGLFDGAVTHAALPARADPQSAALPWVAMGPRNIGGRIRALVQDPKNHATIYAGSAFGGLWKSTNAGDTWTPLGGFLATGKEVAVPVGAIGLAHDGQTLYVGTGEPVPYQFPGVGLYRSTDGGATLPQIDHPATGTIKALRYERILVDPWEPGRAWIACETGLWRSTPGAPPVFAQDAIKAAPPPVEDVTDVAIDFGDRSAVAAPAEFTVYAAIRGDGLYRAVYDRATNAYKGAAGAQWTRLASSAFPAAITDSGKLWQGKGRIKLALCEAEPKFVHAVFCLEDKSASPVFVSKDRGDTWAKTGSRPGDDGTQANYDLVLEVHPDRPDIVITGTVDLFRTMDGGQSWEKIIDWTNYDLGDRAQHGDQHCAFFDRADPRRIWVGNDGGISMSRNLGRTWRKRSHGILAAQFYDVTIHPTYPFVTGGGLQDNGTWVGYGGPSWYRLFGADGGAIGFQHNDIRHFLPSWQGHDNSKAGLVRASIVSRDEDSLAKDSPGERGRYELNPLPDVPGTGPQGGRPFLKMVANQKWLTDGFDSDHRALFGGKLEGHPTRPNQWLVARQFVAYRAKAGTVIGSENGPEFEKLPLPEFQRFMPAGGNPDHFKPEVTALAYAPGAPDTDWWVGTSRGEVFLSTDGGGIWGASLHDPDMQGRWISGIAVHAANSSIVVVTLGRSVRQVFVSGDKGATWRRVANNGSAADGLFGAPVTSVVIDPTGPAGTGAADLQTVYVGTLAGVYVSRNITPAVGGPAPVWRTLNQGMPLVLVQDIAPGATKDAGGAVVRRFLRCATYGRGLFECDLAPNATPAVRLLIRNTVVDDGRAYAGAAVLADDPRLSPGTPMPLDRSIDIRVDAPPFSFFEETLDGVEFDEELRSDKLIAGERNFVYVQVHNTGATVAGAVDVHLYFANAPAAPPDLQANFWGAAFPNAPAGGPWHRAGFVTIKDVGPAQPVVARIDWETPTTLGARVALLAVCTHAQDAIAPPPPPAAPPPLPPLVVDPARPGNLIAAERRAALRIVDVEAFMPDVFVRDGIDDVGVAGAVAWGGRSGDIVVRQAPEAAPDIAFADLSDLHLGDKIKGSADAYIYVRVHNRRRGMPGAALVDLYAVPFGKLARPAEWTLVKAGVAVANIPPHGWKFTPEIKWPAGMADPDPSPSHPFKMYVLVAIIGNADDPRPDHTTIDSIDAFWRFFLRIDQANNGAMRGVRFEP